MKSNTKSKKRDNKKVSKLKVKERKSKIIKRKLVNKSKKNQKTKNKSSNKKKKNKFSKIKQKGGGILTIFQPINIIEKPHLQYAKLKKDPTTYIEVSPNPLDTAFFQHIVNTKDELQFYTKDEKTYLGFTQIPSIVVKEVKSDFKHKVAKGREFVTVKDTNLTSEPYCLLVENNLKWNCIDEQEQERVIVQDVGYVNTITDELNIMKAKCKNGDLDTKIKIDETREIEGKEYRVIIYPDPKETNSTYLRDTDLFTEIQTVCKKHKEETYFPELLRGLYNAFEGSEKLKEHSELLALGLKKSKEYVEVLINKIYDEKKLTVTEKEKEKELEAIETERTRQIKDLNTHTNKKTIDMIKGLFNKPFLNARFIVLFFENKGTKTNKIWNPMIWHLRELNKNHTEVLNVAQKLLDEELPLLLGIESPNYNYLAYARRGTNFHLTYEYIHPANYTLSMTSHVYRNIVTLSELIYSSSLFVEPAQISETTATKTASAPELPAPLDIPFWSSVVIQYDISDYKLEKVPNVIPTKASNLIPHILLKRTSLSQQIKPILDKSNLLDESNLLIKTLQGSTIIACSVLPISEKNAVEIYYEKADNFYYLKLLPILNEIKYEIFSKNELNKSIYNCNDREIFLAKLPQTPVYQVEFEQITPENKETKGLNFMTIPHTFPAMVMKAYPNELDTELKLNISEWYPPHLLEDFNRTQELKSTTFEDDTQKEYYYAKLDIEGTSYQIIIFKHKLGIDQHKFVCWIVEKDVIPEQSSTRLKDVYDLKGDLLQKIIDLLKTQNIYNESIHFLGVNNTMSIFMASLHLHIIPKNFYRSSLNLKDRINFGRELRMISANNVAYNLNFNINYNNTMNFRILSNLKFNLDKIN
jgi:hypothetical protein